MNVAKKIPTGAIGRRWPLVEIWLAVAAWYSLSGWILSALGSLNRVGYASSTLLGGIILTIYLRSQSATMRSGLGRCITIWKHRSRHPLPLIFAGILALAVIGGATHSPNNFDALTYRLPQTLHWLDAGRWHWIATSNDHLNITAPGYSWLMAPMLALTHSDRGFFLPNVIAFALLPGAFFRAACGCGIRRRVAWNWMWILPSGYCFALQAGSIANDLLAASYLLVATSLAFRARHTGEIGAAWFSILAAALGTGVKIVVLPLGLPWLVAIAPSLPILLRRPIASALMVCASLAVSFLPTAALNAKYTGDWAGDPTNKSHMRVDSPLHSVVANSLIIATTNLSPPIWPFATATNRQFSRFVDSPYGETIRQHYPRFDLQWLELAGEDGSGIGLGVCILGGISLAAAGLLRRPATSFHHRRRIGLAMGAASLAAATVYVASLGSEAAPRLMAAYYPFILLPLLLLPAQDTLVRRRWWRVLAGVCAFSIVPTLILGPARPLWPAQTILSKLVAQYPDSAFLRRSKIVCDTFAHRHDHLAALKKFIPPHASTVGFVPTGNDLEGSLWRPFGSRRVIEVLEPTRSDPAIQQLAGSVIICSHRGLHMQFDTTVEDFCAAVGGRLIGEETLILKASVGPEKWCVIAL